MNYKGIGQYITDRRTSLNYSQRELSVMLRVSVHTISLWERGLTAPELSHLAPLAHILGVSVEEILNSNDYSSSINTSDGVIMDKTYITEGSYLVPNNDSIKNKFRVSFGLKDFFIAKKMTRAYKMLTGQDIIANMKDLVRGSLKKHSVKDAEDTFTCGMSNNNMIGVKAPWLYIRVFIFLALITGLSILTDSWSMIIVIGSAVVPFTILFFVFELNFPRNLSIIQVFKCFFIGGLSSFLIVFAMREATGYPDGYLGDLLTGFVEEVSKIIIVYLLIVYYKPRYLLTGLLIGVAVGAGFDAFESAEYGLTSLLEESYYDMLATVIYRAVSAFGAGHHYWTGIAAGALTMVIGNRKAKLKHLFNINFLMALALVIFIHSLWNYSTYVITSFVLTAVTLTLFFMLIRVGYVQYLIANNLETKVNADVEEEREDFDYPKEPYKPLEQGRSVYLDSSNEDNENQEGDK